MRTQTRRRTAVVIALLACAAVSVLWVAVTMGPGQRAGLALDGSGSGSVDSGSVGSVGSVGSGIEGSGSARSGSADSEAAGSSSARSGSAASYPGTVGCRARRDPARQGPCRRVRTPAATVPGRTTARHTALDLAPASPRARTPTPPARVTACPSAWEVPGRSTRAHARWRPSPSSTSVLGTSRSSTYGWSPPAPTGVLPAIWSWATARCERPFSSPAMVGVSTPRCGSACEPQPPTRARARPFRSP